LGQLEPLWLALHRHHRAVSPVKGLVADDAASWSARRADYERWMRAGKAIALVADRPPSAAVGGRAASSRPGAFVIGAARSRYFANRSQGAVESIRRSGVLRPGANRERSCSRFATRLDR
jgi:hypothetical protein